VSISIHTYSHKTQQYIATIQELTENK